MNSKSLRLMILSDGTGETAAGIFRAAMAQFSKYQIYISRYKNIRSQEHLNEILDREGPSHDLLAYTFVEKSLRDFADHYATEHHLRAFDLLGPILSFLSHFFEHDFVAKPGRLREVNEDYFKRVEAMEFTLMNDDGKNITLLEEADIILVGISRTSKTPLSIYLSQLGYKVLNIPLIPGTEIPEKLYTINQQKIFALTIDPQTLFEIRKKRLEKLGSQIHHSYADLKTVSEEIEWANSLYAKNRKWKVFDITGKALEETASDIIRLIQLRDHNPFS
jgi:[pyruvate, water dikinase]-phosphate phosphotransferase / [pyruvate, water dikinase] kinase